MSDIKEAQPKSPDQKQEKKPEEKAPAAAASGAAKGQEKKPKAAAGPSKPAAEQKKKPEEGGSAFGKWIKRLFQKIIFGIVLVLMLLYGFQGKLLYHPSMQYQSPSQNPAPYQHPGQQNMTYKNVTLTAPDNANIRGWFMFANDSVDVEGQRLWPVGEVPTFIFMHENAGNLGMRIHFFRMLVKDLGVNVLAMAYRCYSDSDCPSTVDEAGIKLDSQAVLEFVKDPFKVDEEIAEAMHPQLIFLQGRSLGGAVSLHMAEVDSSHFRGIILENTFTSISDMVDHLFPILSPLKPIILRIQWKSEEIIPKVTLPAFFVTGDRDTLVPMKQTKKLHDLANMAKFKRLLTVKGGTHNDSWLRGRDQYLEMLRQFIIDCVVKYQMPKYDSWQGGSGDDTILKIQDEYMQGKIKIKTVTMPKGSLDKMKQEAKRKPKVQPQTSDSAADVAPAAENDGGVKVTEHVTEQDSPTSTQQKDEL